MILWFRLREIGHLLIVEALLVDHSAQLMHSRLIILTTQEPTLITVNQHAPPNQPAWFLILLIFIIITTFIGILVFFCVVFS